jgi:hypothetical protein
MQAKSSADLVLVRDGFLMLGRRRQTILQDSPNTLRKRMLLVRRYEELRPRLTYSRHWNREMNN